MIHAKQTDDGIFIPVRESDQADREAVCERSMNDSAAENRLFCGFPAVFSNGSSLIIDDFSLEAYS